MSKTASRKRGPAKDEYESDGGFIEDAPKSKKSKSGAAPTSTAGASEMLKDDEGNEYWELSGVRRVQLTEFKGKFMINIREFYEKDGKMLPGKKGISLPVEQFNTVVQLLPSIESALKAKGLAVERPVYDVQATTSGADSHDEVAGGSEDGEADEPDDDAAVADSGRLDKFKHRSKLNHEATSDEDDE